MMRSFAELFKKYRLKAHFTNLSELADALSEKGCMYDPSIISHWQRGKRIPSRRRVLVTLLTLFYERGAIRSLDEANELLESAEHGYLTKREQENLFDN